MSLRLRELIKEVRMAKTAAEERSVISKECSNIRTVIKDEKVEYRHRTVAKLLYIHMLGYPTHFGQMECLKLIVSPSYADKRMGYLGLMLLLDEKQEVLMLVTNSLQTDLNHPNQYVVGLALCSLANISSPGIARDLAPTVIKLMGSSNPYIKKKAALCAIRVVRKVPELMEQFVPKVRPLLAEHNHGVLITAISLMIELCQMEDENIRAFRKTVPTLVKVLKSLVQSGYAPEHDVNGITDPFLQVKILHLMRLIGKGDAQASDVMNDILAQVATNTENARNVGNSILYECVQTIMSIESESGLRVLAINILGRFLLNKDNNIRYVALNTLRRVVNADQQAVQRHRNIIVECLKDHDVSIRRRALDMVYALVNESNIKSLMRELLNYLMSTDYEARSELTAKICWVTEKYAPSPRWHVDTILRVMAISGDQIPEEVVSNTIHLIIETPELQAYAVHKLFTVLSKEILKQPLVQTGVWCLGEFGDLLIESGNGEIKPRDMLDLFDRILRHPSSTSVTKGYVLTAIVKLSDRLKSSGIVDETLVLLDQYRSSIVLEMQQRACEYYSLITNVDEEQRAKLLEKVPALDEGDGEEDGDGEQADATPVATASSTAAAAPATNGSLLGSLLDAPTAPTPSVSLLDGLLNTPSTPAATSSGSSLLELISAPSETPIVPMGIPSMSPMGVPTMSPMGMGLGGVSPIPISPVVPTMTPLAASPVVAPTPVIPAAAAPAAAPDQIPQMLFYDKGGLRITFDFLKKPGDPTVTLINVTCTNASPTPFTQFSFQAAVPKYMKIQLNAPSGNNLPPNNTGRIVQQMMIANSLHGQQPVAIRYLLEFFVNGQRVNEQGTITNFPPGV